MARGEFGKIAAIELAAATGIAFPSVCKILKHLVNAGIIVSVRGAKGGYKLASQPENISVATVINAMEGPIAITECSISLQGCEQASGCNIHANWNVINRTIQNALESVSLADMIQPASKPTEIYVPVASLSTLASVYKLTQ